MSEKMTKWGVGPRFTFYSVLYCVGIVGLTKFIFTIPSITQTLAIPYLALLSIGIGLIVLGIPFYVFSISAVMRAFAEKRLVTNGVYGLCRHPVYTAWLIFFVPAMALLLNSWALLSAPFVMYLFARALVSNEDVFLEEVFGQEYIAYKQRVPGFMPYGWLKKAK